MPNNYDTSDIVSISSPTGNSTSNSDSDILSISPPQNQNTSIGQDILQGFSDVPGIVYEGIKQFPGQVYGAAKQVVTDPVRALSNAAAGAISTGRGINDLPSNIMQYLAKKGLVSDKAANFFPRSRLDNVDIAKASGVTGDEQSGDAFIQALSGYGPFGAAGEAGAISTLGRVGARSGAAAAYGASQGQNPITAAMLGPVTEGLIKSPIAVGKGIASGVNKLRPSNLLSGNLSNTELAENLQAAQGTNTPLADVVGSPKLKKTFESGIAEVPFSGTDKIYKKIADQVDDRGRSLLREAEQKDTIDPTDDTDLLVKKLINSAKEEQTKRKNELYNKRNSLAAQEDFSPDLSGFTKLAKDKNRELDESTILSSIPSYKALLSKTGEYQSANGKNISSAILDEYGRPIINKSVKPTLQEAQTLRSDLYNKGQDLLNSSEGSKKSAGREYMQLYKALSEDINKSIEEKASPELQEAHRNAENNYRTNYSKFLDKDLKKQLVNGEEEQDYEAIVRSIVNPSKVTDRASKINRIQELLPEDKKNTLGYAYLKSAMDRSGKLDPNKLSSSIDKLGPRQFKALFPEKETQQRLDDFVRLNKMNKEALDRMRNPKTGYRGIPSILFTALVGGPKALAGGAGVVGGANLSTRYLTSPQVREKMVQAIIKNQSKANQAQMPHLYLNKFKGYSGPVINQGMVPFDINNQQRNK